MDTIDWTADIARLSDGSHHDPHHVLGPHPVAGSTVVRAFHPDATEIAVAHPGGVVLMTKVHAGGLFEARIAVPQLGGYRLRVRTESASWEAEDPYRFLPTLGELDLHLIGEGTHHELWRRLGARVIEHQGVRGTAFAVWAPNARGVHLVSDANYWDARTWPMRTLGASGVWELFVPYVGDGTRYKFRVTRANGNHVLKADPLARASERPPATASIVDDSHYAWEDASWMRSRAAAQPVNAPMAVYEVHLGSWQRAEDNTVLGYRELAHRLADHCHSTGFTHVELLPVMEHPYGGSWGYQVTGYYSPTARYGTPDDFRYFVDHMHQRGIGVILDWVPAHFPRDDWALARFDGTPLYEHPDPRRGEHPDWGTYVFNYGRNEVRNFLVANARYWAEEFHIDGLRVDAVASMLYLDYSRRPGQWLPNRHGGREHLEAIILLREVNEQLPRDYPGVITIAEESTAWPGVSRPIAGGGLGFTFKWNMGWMHDTLDYFAQDSVYRRYHHQKLTFGLWYAWSENFILPLSHDEVVHLKGSLLGKMSGDRWRKFANLRALFGWMWAHPGKKLLFMGGELAHPGEWSHQTSLPWHLLELPEHGGMLRLMTDLCARYRDIPALYELDDSSNGFHWIDAGNADQNVVAFVRFDAHGHPGLACVANLSPVVHHEFRMGLPLAGRWDEVLNTDADAYGGSGQGNLGGVETEPVRWQAYPDSVRMTLPPLAVVWLAPAAAASA
ncbi:MAG: 1,4-alpha-glucan branching protein GlgB [Candidatus Dormibacteraeota bacterium]|nr:1,4-alpha-glucan branching protein GlgB [Candidatus Dormibacteraeota bacterium]